MRSGLGAGFVLLALAGAASAQVAMEGSFDAESACPAFQSIRKGTNPGNITIQPGVGYKLLGKNKEQATHYWIEVPDASPRQRWVAVECGTVAGAVASGGETASQPIDSASASTDAPFHILAISWQPAFCEGRPNKDECESQTADRYDATHFTLHGLWPQPRDNNYCGVSQDEFNASDGKRWEDLPPVNLSNVTRAALNRVMPGTQSFLDRHEWTKHGTCYLPRDEETYFKDSIRLMDEINASVMQTFVAANIGQTVQSAALRETFEQTFGKGAADRMRISCKDDGSRRLLVEITIGLKGNISAGADMKSLLAAASPTDPGCPSFVVDPVGLQ